MNYSTWAEQAKNNFNKLPDNELRQLASSNEADAAKLANQILMERLNRPAETTKRNEEGRQVHLAA